MNKFFIKAGATVGLLSVAFGAFGAHALRSFLESSQKTETYETAVKYMFYHSLALILTGILQKEYNNSRIINAGYLFLLGIVIFSGSLLLLCATGVTFLGAITPIGGLALIVGWAFLFIGIKSTEKE